MPEAMFRERLERTVPSLELIEKFAADFQTTLTATAIRYTDLCEERRALAFSFDGKVMWTRRSPDFQSWITPGKKVRPCSIAVDFFRTGSLSDRMETIRRDAWVENASERETIKEQSRAFRSSNSVLSLPWIPYELGWKDAIATEPSIDFTKPESFNSKTPSRCAAASKIMTVSRWNLN